MHTLPDSNPLFKVWFPPTTALSAAAVLSERYAGGHPTPAPKSSHAERVTSGGITGTIGVLEQLFVMFLTYLVCQQTTNRFQSS